MNKNMTKGNIFKVLLLFSIPLILSGILQQLYNWVDAVIVGNLVGQSSLAAIGVTSTVSNLFICIISGLTIGVTILISQKYGAKNYKDITKVAGSFVVFLVLLSIFFSFLGIVFTKKILLLMNTPTDIINLAKSYLSIIFVGVPFLTIYNVYGAMLRGIGDSRTPLYAIIVSTITNGILALIFVGVFHMGVSGAAIATVLAQAVSGIYLIIYVYKKYSVLRFKFKKDIISLQILKQGLTLGFPIAIQSSIMAIGSLLLQNVMNSFGTQTVAAVTTAYRIDTIGILPVINVASAISTFVAQNKGAGNMERAKLGLKKGIEIILPMSIITTLAVVFGAPTFMRLFGVSKEVIVMGQQFLFCCSIFYPIFGIQNAYVGFLQGNGDVIVPAISNIVSLMLRIFLSYSLANLIGFRIIAYSEMASWVLGTIICFIRYKSNRWEKLL
ncbi:MATE family efflux transporter [Clostridium akagii]|uniref:MATE family efflux transporter n=1 Tax=Clostridium akagii TaxID=91623 RepID=UPI0009FBBA87|nr:MATE family efflux transporter [Clostridium akagii]